MAIAIARCSAATVDVVVEQDIEWTVDTPPVCFRSNVLQSTKTIITVLLQYYSLVMSMKFCMDKRPDPVNVGHWDFNE